MNYVPSVLKKVRTTLLSTFSYKGIVPYDFFAPVLFFFFVGLGGFIFVDPEKVDVPLLCLSENKKLSSFTSKRFQV